MLWAIVAIASPASAVVIKPVSSVLPGITVTPGFTGSVWVPLLGGRNPDSPTGNSAAALEAFVERPNIYGGNVALAGSGSFPRRGGSTNIPGQIFLMRLNGGGHLLYMYAGLLNNFRFSLPAYIFNNAPIQYTVYTVITPPPPPVPVPPAILLLLTGVCGIAALSRKRRAAMAVVKKMV